VAKAIISNFKGYWKSSKRIITLKSF